MLYLLFCYLYFSWTIVNYKIIDNLRYFGGPCNIGVLNILFTQFMEIEWKRKSKNNTICLHPQELVANGFTIWKIWFPTYLYYPYLKKKFLTRYIKIIALTLLFKILVTISNKESRVPLLVDCYWVFNKHGTNNNAFNCFMHPLLHHSLLGLLPSNWLHHQQAINLIFAPTWYSKLFSDTKIYHKTSCKLCRRGHLKRNQKLMCYLIISTYPYFPLYCTKAQSSKVMEFTVVWDDICCSCHLICQKGQPGISMDKTSYDHQLSN